jgi:hypothetical protein
MKNSFFEWAGEYAIRYDNLINVCLMVKDSRTQGRARGDG